MMADMPTIRVNHDGRYSLVRAVVAVMLLSPELDIGCGLQGDPSVRTDHPPPLMIYWRTIAPAFQLRVAIGTAFNHCLVLWARIGRRFG